jgi:translation initiation factor 1
MSSNERVPNVDSDPFNQSPFAALKSDGLPTIAPTETPAPKTASQRSTRPKDRGRVDILRQTAHRGGKTVTVVKNFVGIGLPEKEQLAKQMQKACGCGGTVKECHIEIQGDKREEVARILTEAGFRPVFAGG